jgi:rare lipoprotein A
MNKQIALLLIAIFSLAGCAGGAKQRAGKSRAPVEDLASGPGGSVIAPAPEPATGSVYQADPAPAPAAAAEPRSEAAAAVIPAQTGSGGYLAGDGPGAETPVNLDEVPDAVPKAEPLHRYANREYTALGKTYKPLDSTGTYKERGVASWYGKKFHGQRTSIGETYDMYAMTAAHPTLPIPSYARVTNVATQKSVVVRVNDRGPFLHNRIIDLSYTAAHKLGIVNSGSAEVEVESIAVDGSSTLTVSTELSVPGKAAAPIIEPALIAAASAPVPAAAPVASVTGKVYLQLGAFKSPQGAESFLAKMRATLGEGGRPLSLIEKDGLQRVHLGPYATQSEARAASEKLKSRLGFKPYVSVR